MKQQTYRGLLVTVALLVPLLLDGCCYFFPCDYFLSVDGIVLNAENKPVSGAQIEATPFQSNDPDSGRYGAYFKARSRTDGCFAMDGFSVPPQNWVPFTAVAPGYKSVAKQVQGTGWIHVIVILIPQGSELGDGKVLSVASDGSSAAFPQCKVPKVPCDKPAANSR